MIKYTAFTKVLNQVNAWQKGKPVTLTVENPDTTARNARMIRVPASQYWGSYKAKESASQGKE